MLSIEFFYITWALSCLLVWLCIFVYRKDLRREMLYISSIFGVAGVGCEFVYTIDWWQPALVVGSRVGIEDFIIGFALGGIAAVIYELFFSPVKCVPDRAWYKPGVLFIMTFGLLFLVYAYVLNLGSFIATLGACAFGIVWIYYYRKDLIFKSVSSGLLFTIFGSIYYWILEFVFPGYFYEYWFLGSQWYTQMFLGIPIEGYIWFFLIGALVGPLYEFIKGVCSGR